MRVTLAPGPAAGDSAAISVAPAGSGLTVVNGVTTGAPGSAASIRTRRLPGSPTLEVRGSIPLGASSSTLQASVDNPTLFFAGALRHALIANGIDVRGPAVDIDDVRDATPASADPLVSYQSAPLSALAVRLMKASQNQYAETFLKTVSDGAGVRSAGAGRLAAQAILEGWGVPAAELILRDGSGLSRYDFVTPAALVAILAPRGSRRAAAGAVRGVAADRGPRRHAVDPHEGDAGRGQRAREDRVDDRRARPRPATSTTADGERLVFSIVANNFETPADVVNAATDAIVVALARFRR